METPNSPLDLISMQRKHEDESSSSFFDAVGEQLFDLRPGLSEIQAVVERLAFFSLESHRETLRHQGDEMPDWARDTWKADAKRWKKVLKLVRDIH